MGRKCCFPKSDLVSFQIIQKSKHRIADTKYRENVQILYELLREALQENTTKDALLNILIDRTAKMEMDIITEVGRDFFLRHKKNFPNLLDIENELWKSHKNPRRWWNHMQKIIKQEADLNSHDHSYSLENVSPGKK